MQATTCTCKEVPKNVNPGGAKDASETGTARAGLAEYNFRGSPCPLTFRSFEEKYRYLRGKSKCADIPFPCCTAQTLACNTCETD